MYVHGRSNATVGSSQVDSDGACHVLHQGAPPKPGSGPMNVRASLLEPHERAAEASVEAARVLASRQLTAV